MEKYKNMTALRFYALSFTWGLPMSMLGVLVCAVLMCAGFKPKRYGYCLCIEVGKGWGGLELGWLFLTNKGAGAATKNHELGHAYQNACELGWSMPLFSIISATRYWLKRFGVKINYYAWWFESQASKIGNYIMQEDETNDNV